MAMLYHFLRQVMMQPSYRSKSHTHVACYLSVVVTGEPTDEQLQLIRTRKPEAPVIEVDMKDGSKKRLWCTFGPQQIDINPFSKSGMQQMRMKISLAM